jgi:hypothetical protein
MNRSPLLVFHKKNAQLLPKMSVPENPNAGCQEMWLISRQPGYPRLRTRGFASPDYSGFARSEIFEFILMFA